MDEDRGVVMEKSTFDGCGMTLPPALRSINQTNL